MKQTSFGVPDIKYADIRGGRIKPGTIPECEIIDTIFKHYRNIGFPYQEPQDKEKVVKELTNFNTNTIVKGDTIGKNMLGLGFLNPYFKHKWSVPCSGHKTPLEVYKNDEDFRTVITKVWHWAVKHEGCKVSENRIRQGLKIYGGAYTVSNFRPTVAKYIYEKYGGPIVYDMSCGWGGRLLGALCSKNVKEYRGCEPATKTYTSLLKLSDDLGFIGKKVYIRYCGSEDFDTWKNYADISFTSPPYFDTEHYSNEDTQSYIAYPTLKEWLEQFLKRMLYNAYETTKVGGHIVINIANTPKYECLESETFEFLSGILGLEHVKTHKMILSSIAGKGQKTEPIFVFKKLS